MRSKFEERQNALFEVRALNARAAIEQRIEQYIQILKATKGIFKVSDSVTRQQWHDYYYTSDIGKSYPGVQGVGFTKYLRPEEVPIHERQVREEGFPGYKVRPAGERAEYTAIVYLEPFDERNKRAFGFDMYSEPVRRKAMAQARDTGLPALSGKVTLVQETGTDVQAGFLIYLPVYRSDETPPTIQERRRLLEGYVYSPFRAADLMNTVLSNRFENMDVEVFDDSTMTEASLIYDRDGTFRAMNSGNEPLSRNLPLRIAGHTWLLHFSALPGIYSDTEYFAPFLVLNGGSIISLLTFFGLVAMLRTKRSNQLKQTITDNATAALFVIDLDGFCTFINPAAEQMTGYTFAELKGTRLHNLIHRHPDGTPFPESECVIIQSQRQHVALRAHHDIFVKKDGTFFHVSCSSRPIVEGGAVVATLLEVRDITEEKRAQQAIEESEQRFRNMADNAPVMIWMTDPDGECNYLNRQWRQFTGHQALEGLGRDWLRAVHPEDLKSVLSEMEVSHRERRPFLIDFRLRRSDNVYRWVVHRGTPRFSPSKEFLGFIGTVSDITDRKEAERQVKENADMLRKVFLKVPAIVGLMRVPDQVYVLANPLLMDLFGNREIVGKTAREAHPELKGHGFFKQLDKVIKTGEAFVGNEMPAVIDSGNDGTLVQRYFNIVYQPMFDDKGQVEAVLLFAVDVTELVLGRQQLAAAIEELKQKNKELIRTNTDLDNFVYTASHDLKSPIANLEGLTSELKHSLKEVVAPEDYRLLELVAISVDKLKKTIGDLAIITKVQKEIQDEIDYLRFDDVLQDVKQDIQNLIEESGVVIQSDFQVQEISYASKNLRSIIYNLVSNAIKYRSQDRQLEVYLETKELPDYVLLTVRDNGLGIKPNQLSKLFKMFTRLHSHVEGTGIGLYIVKRIIENNGGKIEVDSTIGKGTEFRVYFRKQLVS